ncbi:MAG: tripartite tricarboxylate transporter substrate binding protein [Pseudomonadota bacterium]
MHIRIGSLAMMAGLLCAHATVHAQNYPNRPIRMVVAYAPGGTTDFTARVIGPKLAETLGQQVVIDNRGGAGSLIGTDLVAKAGADGYTLLMADTAFGIVPALYAKLPFDVQKDFAPVMQIISMPNCLVVHPSLPVKSVKELIALARTRPGQLTFGSGGVGTPLHMGGEQLKVAAKIDIVHVPYKGAAPAMGDLVGGQLAMVFPTMTLGVPQVRAGKLRALAVTSARRTAALPDVPTMTEAGFPAVNATSWFGLAAPAKTPKAVVDRLHTEMVKIVNMPDVRERFEAQHAEIVGGAPDAMTKFVANEIAQWKVVAKAGNIKAE